MNRRTIAMGTVLGLLLSSLPVLGREYHVSVKGDDGNSGTAERPLKTISAAARLAQPGDVVTVHEGTYRERVSPPRGGRSDTERIVYRAAEGEHVVIKGSEVVDGWQKVQGGVWKVTLPNTFFGQYNPYRDLIRGDWFANRGREHHTGEVYFNGTSRWEAASLSDVLEAKDGRRWWYCRADKDKTTLWADFGDADPNAALVEINVRRACFYPDKPGVNYITVRGFTMRHAATQWAPPTAEQIGLIGTRWSKGWIIENNVISHSRCTGITLGKYGDRWDNTSQNSAEGYVKTIERALENGWSKDNIGHHVVRNNHVAHCEQAGIVGSMGAVFSTVTGNEIHDIHVRRLFGGAEIAGIKFHGAIDTVISGNHIYRTYRGIWLDWMTQGTRVTGNLLHDNGPREDLFVEVNHGPFLVDNNLFLSAIALLDASQGGAYVHNLFAGSIATRAERTRLTPFHKAHSTQVAALRKISVNDERFYNNIFVGHNGLARYDEARLPVTMDGNVLLGGAQPCKHEPNPVVDSKFTPGVKLVDKPEGVYLQIALDKTWAKKRKRPLVTTELLGRAATPNLPYKQPDGSPYRLDTDYSGNKRDNANPFPGPFARPGGGKDTLKVWPKSGG